MYNIDKYLQAKCYNNNIIAFLYNDEQKSKIQRANNFIANNFIHFILKY